MPHTSSTSHKSHHQTIPVFQNNFVMPSAVNGVKFNNMAQKTASNGFYSSKHQGPQPQMIVNNNIMINQSIVITNQNGGGNNGSHSPKMTS